jgi:hypothetical protein
MENQVNAQILNQIKPNLTLAEQCCTMLNNVDEVGWFELVVTLLKTQEGTTQSKPYLLWSCHMQVKG